MGRSRVVEQISSEKLCIRLMEREDIPALCRAAGDAEYLERQLQNRDRGECAALIALWNGEAAGHVFCYYRCRWGGMGGQGLPCIVDLAVFEKFRRRGIATALMDRAEELARKYACRVYLDVDLDGGSGRAQRMYAKRGYLPDGKGAYLDGSPCPDDVSRPPGDLSLCMVKELA